jgi:metal-dependent HD superfamily phosphatase/phosphodiesterase
MAALTLMDLKSDPEVTVYLTQGNQFLSNLGFTEHGIRHASLVATLAYDVLQSLGYSQRECELAAMAGYLHDIANMVNRFNHGATGAMIAYHILAKLGMEPSEIALVVSAIGNHEEERGNAISNIAAAVILADKSDVHRKRVTKSDFAKFEIHDRVNYAAESSELCVDAVKKAVTLTVTIDTSICPVMEYFEIFLLRMVMCRRAAEFLGCHYNLVINNYELL